MRDIFPITLGVSVACLIIGFYAYISIYQRDMDAYNKAYVELVHMCMGAPKRALMVCERYATWVLERVKPYHLNFCYDKYEKRNYKNYPSIVVCTAIYKVSFNIWTTVSPNYCFSEPVC